MKMSKAFICVVFFVIIFGGECDDQTTGQPTDEPVKTTTEDPSDNNGFAWNLKEDKFVDKSACYRNARFSWAHVNDDQPRSTYMVTPGGTAPDYVKEVYLGETLAASLDKPNGTEIGGFTGTEPIYKTCFNEDASKIYTIAFNDASMEDETYTKCLEFKKKGKVFPEKYGGFIRDKNVYLFGAEKVYKFARTAWETNNQTQSETVDVTGITYVDFFKCPKAPEKSAGFGKGATTWIIVGVIVAIVIALLTLYCIFGMKQNKERFKAHKSNRSKKSLRHKDCSLKKLKSSSRKSARKVKTGSRKSLRGFKSGSRKSLKGVKSSSRKSLKKSSGGKRSGTGSRKSLKK